MFPLRFWSRKNPNAAAHPFGAEFVIELDRPRRFKLNTAGLAEIKGITGLDPLGPDFFGAKFSVANMIVFFWVGLKGDDPSLTLKQAAEFCRPVGLAAMKRALDARVKSIRAAGRN